MLSRSAVSRAGQLALRRQPVCACVRAPSSRTFAAAAATGSPAFEPTEVAGVTVVSKDFLGPTTKLAIVAKAGTRYQPAPGLTAGLEGFAFKNTLKRSALRITRESELLGGQLTAYHTREAVVLEANFLREHLPYFTELLSEVVSQTKFTSHELAEDIEPVLHIQQERYTANSLSRALDAAHASAFHAGLGEALAPTTLSAPHLSVHGVAAYAASAYARPNLALVAEGASSEALAKWTEIFFKENPAASPDAAPLNTAASKYYGGQMRADSAFGNAVVIGFSTSGLNAADPAAAVLAALLGGQSGIKWSPGFSLLAKATDDLLVDTAASNLLYSDAGLFTIQISGSSAAAVRKAAEEAVQAVKSVATGTVSKENLTKAIAKAKFDALVANETGSAALTAAGSAVLHGLKAFKAADVQSFSSVTTDKVKALAKKFLDSKASVGVVGDLHKLPYAEDLGLKV